MQYKLIALDVDGTLLNDDYELTERTVSTLRQVHEAGGRIVLCTGRAPASSVPIMEQLGFEGVLIAHNGAATVETPGSRLLHEFAFPIQDIAELVQYCRAEEVHFDMNTSWDMYVEKVGEAEAAMYEKYMAAPEQVEDVLAMSVSIVKFTMFGSEEAMDRVEQNLGSLHLPPTLHAIRSGVHFIDVMLNSVSKGRALSELSEMWGIEASSILAMGNYFNDIDMLRFAGLGIAMDNSPEEVKLAADTVTLSNNEEGVAEALMRYVWTESTN
ncbi:MULTISPECIES: Cof-type HAD-IIB family hydrolase [unclassified Paenibacillus]|uniref:Cof-type HAD-IIB family hydrolase n=1 Tax=unclassified Paenibacillus TaxID=185978 RepID=UPI001AE75FA5|nr:MULTISPECIES: Cof-type HAD-IIB family hydrolase [unclassified Paenibacillus]MBP1154796.1 Cof subfamily protein (haloacid dehalogenase superfamily) [Paenibacillus sp. PvP091]MBP1169820.1 Cof subfamily protein (haloacid dehalogenase superfamily) [Paenibacillus sp. PvR098]MBP2440848.1 Cof subfamily protein (haloacid dehalogenase superfamily) [Paenibacillus sp. PvP052]